MPWKIEIWIPVEMDNLLIFNSKEEAENEAEHLSFLQPENIYKIKEVKNHE